jgi:hypothetical protein
MPTVVRCRPPNLLICSCFLPHITCASRRHLNAAPARKRCIGTAPPDLDRARKLPLPGKRRADGAARLPTGKSLKPIRTGFKTQHRRRRAGQVTSGHVMCGRQSTIAPRSTTGDGRGPDACPERAADHRTAVKLAVGDVTTRARKARWSIPTRTTFSTLRCASASSTDSNRIDSTTIPAGGRHERRLRPRLRSRPLVSVVPAAPPRAISHFEIHRWNTIRD